MSSLNTTSGEVSIEVPTIGGLTPGELITYSTVNVLLFILIIILACTYKMNYFHVVDEKRI